MLVDCFLMGNRKEKEAPTLLLIYINDGCKFGQIKRGWAQLKLKEEKKTKPKARLLMFSSGWRKGGFTKIGPHINSHS